MAYEGWIEFNGVELVNVARTLRLARSMGVHTVRVKESSAQWIEGELSDAGFGTGFSGFGTGPFGGVDFGDITTAPWYDAGYAGSSEFAGFLTLRFQGLDDSSLESNSTEYIGDGSHPGRPRHGSLPLVASFAIIAKTERGAEYGKRWLDRVLRGPIEKTVSSGFDLHYFRYAADGAPKVHRRDVTTTRGTSITSKRATNCAVTWMVTFTMTAHDSYEYGEPVDMVQVGPNAAGNRAANPAQVTGGSTAERMPRFSATPSYQTGSGLASPLPDTYTRFTQAGTTGTGRGVDWYANSDNPPATTGAAMTSPVVEGVPITVSAWVRLTSSSVGGVSFSARFHDGAGNWVGAVSFGSGLTMTSGVWARLSRTLTPPAGAKYVSFRLRMEGTTTAGDLLDQTALMVTSTPGPVDYDGTAYGPMMLTTGSLTTTQQTCPQFDYSPIYDPLYPALVPSPMAPNFYPEGWNMPAGRAFKRFWTRVSAVEPSNLLYVPVITLTTSVAARMVRVQIWPDASPTNDQCDPLFTAIISYLPASVPELQIVQKFIIDGEQKASYVDDGFSPVVRRVDSLVFGEDANPVDWTAFTDNSSLLVTLDVFADSDGYEGNDQVRAALSLVPKSD